MISQVTFASPSSMINLSKYSFSQCTHLRDIINIPDTIENIESNCFESTQISTFVVPISTTSIGNYAFRGCSEMTVFKIPSRCLLRSIGNYIFDGCVSLSTIECPDSDFFVIDNGALFNKNRSNLICFPPASSITFFCFSQNVKSVSSSAFFGCKNLVGIMIPDNSITSIGHSAFADCTSLKYINIPLCVKNIDQNVFTGCTSLYCGVVVQNTSISFRMSLVTNSGLSFTSMKDCGLITCKHDSCRIPVPSLISLFLF
ncbi:surface antigen BspA-like [Trichomonas vaginalis G3]|uniref:Surface antigen BspA-like n=1 Tax=Trichomonas vaginalis (strain ATCC PRA-98 / G3) TaxID=412133 RepID=A2FUG6_TRIV3|nr:regulation of response to stimulus [Trichomonas vaginalis G3]EAX91461.1 surface antigen BspA-like [Trichomonas vaginalis G3]KAI5510560.1 regulation of response to stimulus [Trichomonas vaginalis G3]|eukprot:XP_001304391.1 surface antigen BspA-like [Trichomonas vaginalis G3]